MSTEITPTTDSIKKRIMDQVLANLTTLEAATNDNAVKIRSVTREMNVALLAPATPSIQIYDLDEKQIAADQQGRTFMFPVLIKLIITDVRDLGAAKDALVPKVQAIMEALENLQLGGLAVKVEGGAEQPFIAESEKPMGGAMLSYEITYRRVRGNPYQTY